MQRTFTTRELLASVALIAVGAACLRPVLGTDSSNPTTLEAVMFIGGWFGSGMAFGGAITGLFFNNWLGGVTAGLAIQFILLLLLSGAY